MQIVISEWTLYIYITYSYKFIRISIQKENDQNNVSIVSPLTLIVNLDEIRNPEKLGFLSKLTMKSFGVLCCSGPRYLWHR